jgi:hypothetical protein
VRGLATAKDGGAGAGSKALEYRHGWQLQKFNTGSVFACKRAATKNSKLHNPAEPFSPKALDS